MNQERLATPCGVCGTGVRDEGTICDECQRAFEPMSDGENRLETELLDLRKYDSRMFPWEQTAVQPRLINVNPLRLAALGLVVLVLLLALVRTPLPSCWEISS